MESDPRPRGRCRRALRAAAPDRSALPWGLHVAGPSFGLTFATQPGSASDTTTNPASSPSRVLTGDVGVGLSLALGESFSFVEMSAQERFARTSRRAARMHAAVSAIAAIAAGSNARERTRLEPNRRAARGRTVLLTSPRLSAAQIGPNALAYAESTYAASPADVLEAQADWERSRLLRAQRNIKPSERVLDEFGRVASTDLGVALQNALTEAAPSLHTADVAAARTRADLAWAGVGASFLRLLDPITFFAEFEPFGEWDSPPTDGAGLGAPTRDARVDLALRLGVNPKAAGEIAERVAIADARQAEVGVAERAARNALAERRARIDARSGSWRASAHALEAARRAFEETDRRYRVGESGVSIDRRSECPRRALRRRAGRARRARRRSRRLSGGPLAVQPRRDGSFFAFHRIEQPKKHTWAGAKAMTFKRVTRFVFWSIAPSALIACSQGASPGNPSADASDETQTVGPDSAQPNCAQSGPADADVPADVSLEASPEASETSSADEASSGGWRGATGGRSRCRMAARTKPLRLRRSEGGFQSGSSERGRGASLGDPHVARLERLSPMPVLQPPSSILRYDCLKQQSVGWLPGDPDHLHRCIRA